MNNSISRSRSLCHTQAYTLTRTHSHAHTHTHTHRGMQWYARCLGRQFLNWKFYTHLNVFPSVKHNVLGFNLAVFDIHLVTTEYHWYVTAHPVQVSVPDWNISVRGGRCYIKHQYGTVSCSKKPQNISFADQ